ncbi:MAG TPA: ferredoxin, partial [Holophagaceae bacterium]|nr:ferredoxin [Holophagaceae bacterium]
CNVPQVVAPDLFGEMHDGDGYLHCFVKRQPATAAEHALMLEVMASAELACIRYSGRDYGIQKRMIRAVPSEIDHIHPALFHRFLFSRMKARWAIFKWRAKRNLLRKKT